MSKPPFLKAGQPIRAKTQNWIINQLGGLPGTGIDGVLGHGGSTLTAGVRSGAQLFEAAEDFTIPEGQPDDWPRGRASEVWRYERDGLNRYKAARGREAVLFDPLTAQPLLKGERAWATFNKQSGRWEVVCRVQPGLFPCYVKTNDKPVTAVSHPDGIEVYPIKRLEGGGFAIDRDKAKDARADFITGVLFGGVNPPEEEPEEGDPEPPEPTLGDFVLAAAVGPDLQIVTQGGTLFEGTLLPFVDWPYKGTAEIHGVTYTFDFDPAGYPHGMLMAGGNDITVYWNWNQQKFMLFNLGCPPPPE